MALVQIPVMAECFKDYPWLITCAALYTGLGGLRASGFPLKNYFNHMMIIRCLWIDLVYNVQKNGIPFCLEDSLAGSREAGRPEQGW